MRLKITQPRNENIAHGNVVVFLCMLLITLTFTDLSFAHEFYCAIKKEAWNVDYIFWTSFCAIWRCTVYMHESQYFSLHNHNSFFFLFASNNKRGWREKLLKSRVWYESRKNSRTTHENTPQMFFSVFFFSFSISIKRIVNCSWERKEMKIIAGWRKEQRMMSRERRN